MSCAICTTARPADPSRLGHPPSRRIDIQRVKESFTSRLSRPRSVSGGHDVGPLREIGTGVYIDGDAVHHAHVMPIWKLSKKQSSPDMRKVSSRKASAASHTESFPTASLERSTSTKAGLADGHFPPTTTNILHIQGLSDPRMPIRRTETPVEPEDFRDSNQNFDLAPPPPKQKVSTVDGLSVRLYSDDHLRLILRDSAYFTRFANFLGRYKPQTAALLTRYLDSQRAIKAVEYANAVADTIGPLPHDHGAFQPTSAAPLEATFEAMSRQAFDDLVDEALPAYISRTLIDVVGDIMIKDITGHTLPIMKDLVGGLSEVFCMTDPSVRDNPIVYASEEFYRTTQYGRDSVIGRNCRFLQGPKTHRPTVARLSAACIEGKEISELILNYRRDGTPFLNLLMCAPLFDNRGVVRYFIGAQVDVSGLVEGGKGIESFERLLAEDREKENYGEEIPPQANDRPDAAQRPLKALGELGELLSHDEIMEIHMHSREDNVMDDAASFISHARVPTRQNVRSAGRRLLGEHEQQETSGGHVLSGRLPGVYQNYFLVRPAPSLRIIFVSPALRIPGLLQSHFLSRVGGPSHIREGLADAFANNVPVTARVNWLTGTNTNNGGMAEYSTFDDTSTISSMESLVPIGQGTRHGPNDSGVHAQSRSRWLNCTPLFGSDDRVGVWMVVMVEDDRPSGLQSRAGHRSERVKRVAPSPSGSGSLGNVNTEEWPMPAGKSEKIADPLASPRGQSNLRVQPQSPTTYANGHFYNEREQLPRIPSTDGPMRAGSPRIQSTDVPIRGSSRMNGANGGGLSGFVPDQQQAHLYQPLGQSQPMPMPTQRPRKLSVESKRVGWMSPRRFDVPQDDLETIAMGRGLGDQTGDGMGREVRVR